MLLNSEGNNFYTRVLYPAKLLIGYDNKNKDIFGQEWSLKITFQALFFPGESWETYTLLVSRKWTEEEKGDKGSSSQDRGKVK